jgi:tetratricopeptide (TPR) repeat protein
MARNMIGNRNDEECYKTAEMYYIYALEIYRREYGPHGKSFGMAQTLCNLGNLSFLADNTKDAEAYYKRSLATYSRSNEINRHVPKEISEAMSSLLNNLGSLSRQQKDYTEAFDYFKQALSFEYMTYGGVDCKNINVASTLSNCGHISVKLGKHEQALRFYQRAIETYPSGESNKGTIAGVMIRMGTTNFHINNIQAARQHYQEALQLYENADNNSHKALQEADAWHCMGVLERKVHNVSAAVSHQEKALDALNDHLKKRVPTQSTQRLKNAIKSELINLDSCCSFNRLRNDVKSSSRKNDNDQSRFRLWPGTGRTKRM